MERPQQIAATININKPVATQIENVPSLSATNGSENSSLKGIGADEGTPGNIVKTFIPETPKPNELVAVRTAEIMPQYPGGIQALLAFFKKNIHSPDDVDNGEEVKVEIGFVVNFNGRLESFDVIKSGGKVFDNEF